MKHLLRNKFTMYVVTLMILIVAVMYVYFSNIGYSSDFALIGLLAKRTMETGQQFLFVPLANYQGLLLEVNTIVLFFKIFGINLTTLNFAPFVFYITFMFIFYHSVKLWHNKTIATLSTLFLGVSAPIFHIQLIRTQPNYSETFLMGMLLFYIYGKIMKSPQPRHKLLMFIGGVIMGFGYYTYGQIVFFIGAIGLHLILQAIHFYKYTSLKTTWITRSNKFFAIFMGLSFVLFLVTDDVETIHIGSFLQIDNRKSNTSSAIVVGFILWGLTYVLWAIIHNFTQFKKWIPSVCLTIVGFIVGVFPKIYYSLVLGESSVSRLGVGGTVSEILFRIKVFIQIHAEFLNLQYINHLEYLALIAFLIFIFSALFYKGKSIFSFTGKNYKLKKISPFFLLGFVTLIGFTVAMNVKDLPAGRYALNMLITYSVLFSCGIIYLWHWVQKKYKWMLVVGMSLILMNNIYATTHKLLFSKGNDIHQDITEYLKKEDIQFGYGNYWRSYIVNFYTNEKIILEPTISNYIPYYLKPVQKANRVAYVEYLERYPNDHITENYLDQIPKEFNFYGQKYIYIKHHIIKDTIIFILDKKL